MWCDYKIRWAVRLRFILGMSPPDDIDGLSAAELKDLLLKASAKMADMQRTIAALRDEIARLKVDSGRPTIKPNVKPSGARPAARAAQCQQA